MSETNEGEPNKVIGFVVMSGEQKYLGVGMGWFADQSPEDQAKRLVWTNLHDKPEDARVFSQEMMQTIVQSVDKDNWGIKPTHAIPAVWSEDGGVVVTGEKIKIEDLPPVEKN